VAPATFSMSNRTGCLPAELDVFVGRRTELADIRRLASTSSLLTLQGMGGVGKTRLALRAAHGLRRSFGDAVTYVELGSLRDPALLLQTIAEHLGLHERSRVLDLGALVAFLKTGRRLIVLDCCEHLLAEVAELVDRLLRGCPELHILATSRQRLGVSGEKVFRVAPLSTPRAQERVMSIDELGTYEGVRLFLERAAVWAPSTAVVGDDDVATVAQICTRLEGIPLALELAAARLRTLTLRQLADRLDKPYDLLTGGARNAPRRHHTLRLCIDSSYEQCSVSERLLWGRLAVFVGGFDLEAAEETCGFGAISSDQVLDLLSALVDKSMVVRDATRAGPQFRLVETLRDYALERLVDAGEIEEVRRRHSDWYTRCVERFRADLIGPRQLELAAGIDRQLANIRAALEFNLGTSGSPADALRVAGALNLYWVSRGLLSEGRYWASRALDMADVGDAGDAEGLARYSVVMLAGLQGDVVAAADATTECYRTARRVASQKSAAHVAATGGLLAMFTGDLTAAVVDLDEAAECYRRLDDSALFVETKIAAGLAAALLGDQVRSESCNRQILEVTTAAGEIWHRAYSLWVCGLARWRSGSLASARNQLEESLRLRQQMSDPLGSAWCLEALAFVAADEEQYERAAVLLGAAAALSHEAGTPTATFPDLASAYHAAVGRVGLHLGTSGHDFHFSRGREMGYSRAVEFALGVSVAASPPAASGPAQMILTARQLEVARLVARGRTNRAIAAELVISERTAQGHVENILVKLSFTSRSQIAAWFVENGHNQPPPRA